MTTISDRAEAICHRLDYTNLGNGWGCRGSDAGDVGEDGGQRMKWRILSILYVVAAMLLPLALELYFPNPLNRPKFRSAFWTMESIAFFGGLLVVVLGCGLDLTEEESQPGSFGGDPITPSAL